ncbi:hypothetical protein GU243_14050 [Pseudarthrobacter psychrotolerans]|uniref:Uncharacterized protein n=1 Tax=Pseudarthrobacter psychrotolerans TaxID=2697569 RepID=A0A6P1NJX9_9MICC|nr:hypothetical protein [Pseudarthrobacter psychrotolerans]QHK20666.1 hypothetical protein GU243_14050 [Pseudarthrobacter psychrotolerans]
MSEKIMAVIEQVGEGRHVVASDGETDPETGGLVNTVIVGFAATSKLPRHTAERLLRIGYVKVDRK